MRSKIMGWLTWGIAVAITALLALIVIDGLVRVLRWVLAGV